MTATDWNQAMHDAQRWLGVRKIWLNRGDLGLGHDAIMSWHEDAAERHEALSRFAEARRQSDPRG